MPRTTYKTRLETLLAGPMSAGDRRFATSLLDFYNRKQRLTTGRARCVKQLEERYSAEALAARQGASEAIVERLSTLSAEVALSGSDWEREFVTSLCDQAQIRELSQRQIEILEKIESRFTPEAKEQAASWTRRYNTFDQADGLTPRDRAIIAAKYYLTTSYFTGLAKRVVDEPDFVPSIKAYRKMVENKYAQKIIEAANSEAKYPVGSFVALRSQASYALRRATGGLPCAVLKTDAETPTSAARGAKKYLVLPLGMPKPVMIEERYIKKARKL